MHEPLYTTEEVAKYLRIDVVTVRRLVNRGELKAYRVAGEFRFLGRDVDRFLRDHLIQPTEESDASSTADGALPGGIPEPGTEGP